MLDLSGARTRPLVGSTVPAIGAALAAVAPASSAAAADPVTTNLLGINDVHGRIDPNITVEWGYEIEHLRDQAVTAHDLKVSYLLARSTGRSTRPCPSVCAGDLPGPRRSRPLER